MLNRLKTIFESVVYAGMKPGARSAEGTPTAKPGFFARMLNGPSQSDPLYLTNQTSGQKARRILLMLSPMLLVIVGGLVAIKVFAPKTTSAPRALTAAEVRARVLPIFNKEIIVDSNKDLEVTEVHFEHTAGNLIAGNIRNKTNHQIIQAVVVFDLADPSNSGIGGVTVTETNLAPGASRSFRMPIEQANATYALVRQVDTK
jgi:hypothetical protein